MGDAAQGPTQIISLPKGGGAVRGIGETFIADPQTGTGSYSIPVLTPPGRRGFQPTLTLGYSTGSGNGFFGLGWSLSVPGIARKTSRGVPTYDDDRDVFILSGCEDLVALAPTPDGGVQYRPRTEGLFARIVHYRDRAVGQDFWEVVGKDGLISRYGSERPTTAGWTDPAVIADPADPTRVFAWKLTETRDPLGNLIVYEYDVDAGDQDGHRWRQPVLRAIRYADRIDDSGTRVFFATVSFADEPREDAFSSYTAGFEIRTTRRCASVTTAVHPAAEVPVRRYELRYDNAPLNGVSLLREVELVGFDDTGAAHHDLPPVSFAYSRLEPGRRRFQPVGGPDLPAAPLSDPGYELVDLTGDGLPDILQCNGVVRYWRNRGDGTFDRARSMRDAPAAGQLGTAGVRLLDADGDGRADLMVNTATQSSYYRLRFGPSWGPRRSHSLAAAPALTDPQLKLLDLDGDGVTDAIQAGSWLRCWFNDPELGWSGPQAVQLPAEDPPPDLDLADPRVRWADMTGDGLADLVVIRGREVDYWPNLGRGRFGRRIRMASTLALPAGYDPARLQLGDIGGDGLSDLVLVEADRVTVWINQSGNAWSEPIVVRGLPTSGWDARIADLLGTGTGGLLCSRATGGEGRPSMFFLDLTGGVKPGLLIEVDNHIGAATTIEYLSSTTLAARDHPDPRTRWRTPLPFPVPVVDRVRVTDEVSHSVLSTEYRYRHGYWDGLEREFRGFGRVEQTDTETRDGAGPGVAQSSPPTLTRTWFHLGPVDAEDDDWTELDLSVEHWGGDRQLLDHSGQVRRFLDGLPNGTSRRDALRVLRGRSLRTELYALDGSSRQDRPCVVTEHAYELRDEPAGGAKPVFVAFEVAQRTTRWERGDDPMTRFSFTGDHDEAGQPRRHTVIAPPRRSARRQPVPAAVVGNIDPDPVTVLATHQRTRYADDIAGVGIRDRVADVRTYQLAVPPGVSEADPDDVAAVLADQDRVAQEIQDAFDLLDPADVELIGHVLHHYDGPGYVGLTPGLLGDHGLLTRSETLVHTEAVLLEAYGDWRPSYLDGPAPLPAGAPPDFGTDLGYRKEPVGDWYVAGWYADTTRQAYDVQLSTAAAPVPQRGLVLGTQDALGNETRVTPDVHWLVPVSLRDPAGLNTVATPHYRTGQPQQVVDPNGTEHHFRYHPLGMLTAAYRVGIDGRAGTEDRPEIIHSYDLAAFQETGHPISVRTSRRVHYASDGISDDTVELWEYSDGFGRVVQERAQADDLAFGADGDDAGLLVPAPGGGPASPVPGAVGGPAVGRRETDRVVVGGWRVYDNKGRVIEQYQPFLSVGPSYEDEAPRGRPARMAYDALGRLVRVINPDGSQRRTLLGVPADLAELDDHEPTPWVTTGYDENDLAAVSVGRDGASMAGRVPVEQHFTPISTVQDAFDRIVCRITRGTADSAGWHVTRTSYDVRANVLGVVDELGRTAMTRTYDLVNHVLRDDSIDAGRRISVLDAAGNLRQRRDARGAETLRTYDVLNRLSELVACDASGQRATLRERLTYGDADPDRQAARSARRLGRLWTHLDEAGLATVESYDLTGAVTELTRRVVSDGALAAADAGGGWTADWATMALDDVLDRREDRTSMRNDALGRAFEVTAPEDAEGHRPRLLATFSRSGALRAVQRDDEAHVRLLVRNARGQRVLLALGNGLVTRYAYDPDTFRLVRLRTERASVVDDVWTGGGSPLQDLTYSYDLLGNVTVIEERTPGCGVAGTAEGRDRLVRTFDYDGFARLVSATGRECASVPAPRPLDDPARCGAFGAPFTAPPSAPDQTNAPDLTVAYQERYTYDPAGNVVDLHHRSATGSGDGWHRRFGMGGLAPDAWAEAPNNRLTSLEAGATTSTFGYDAAGNLQTENDAREFKWDHAGRVVGFRVHAGAGTSVSARYLYGADGVRVKKWVRRSDSAALDESTVYLGNLLERHRWTKSGGAQNTLLHIMDDATRVAIVRSGAAHPDDAGPRVRYELGDHLGSSAVTVDGTGEWVNREEHFPYGEASFGSFARKRYRFSGKERDEESGLAYHGARYYFPGIMRWTACDPIVPPGAPGRPYAYCDGRPLVSVDPNGGHPILLMIVAAVLISLALPNTANAPKPGDRTLPSMSEGEFAVKGAVLLASGGLAGSVEAGAVGVVGRSMAGRIAAGTVGGLAGGGAGALGMQGADDAFRGRLSTAGQYLHSAGWGMAFGGVAGAFGGAVSGARPSPRAPAPTRSASVEEPYIPRQASGEPIPLERQWEQASQVGKDATGIPRPDPRAGGGPHTVLGGRVSSGDGKLYRQSATFTEEGNQTLMRGYGDSGQLLPQAEPVPVGRVDWGTHGRPVEHANPHIHGYSTVRSPNSGATTIVEEPARGWTPPQK